MKKFYSQWSIALVCCILGIMISYQFRIINSQEKNLNTDKVNPEIVQEVEGLKKQKLDLEKNLNGLQSQLKKYEEAAAGKNEISKEMLKKLEDTRMMIGETDITGEGIILYITPQTEIFGNNSGQPINDRDLVFIANELNSAGAEAISINDIRIMARTGIRNARNAILINDSKISPWKRITIKAIGDKKLLDGALNFPGNLPDFTDCKVEIQQSNDIKINKNTKSYKFEYAKPVKE